EDILPPRIRRRWPGSLKQAYDDVVHDGTLLLGARPPSGRCGEERLLSRLSGRRVDADAAFRADTDPALAAEESEIMEEVQPIGEHVTPWKSGHGEEADAVSKERQLHALQPIGKRSFRRQQAPRHARLVPSTPQPGGGLERGGIQRPEPRRQ